jgi:hypothetical protein
MIDITRQSPIKFETSPSRTVVRENWTIALEYDDEGDGPWLTDLAHKARWDLQDGNIDQIAPCSLAMPTSPGQCTLTEDTLVNRMNGTQASIYHIGADTPAVPDMAGYTDVSEATVFLALYGPRALLVAEKLTNLDLLNPASEAPFLLQGPFCHVPCQIVVLDKNSDVSGGFLLTCSRGYGDSIVEAIQKAGSEFGLKPAGEICFNTWIKSIGN